jgi:uncharacterized membrane protein YkoI
MSSSRRHLTNARLVRMKSLVTVGLMFVAIAVVLAAGKKMLMRDLPLAVQKAVQQEVTKGATVKNIVEEKAGGATVYEVETIVGGRTRDLIFDRTGILVESEEEVSIDTVPAPVKAVLESIGKVLKVETVTKGARTTYEAQVETKGKKSQVAVDASGKRLKS